MDQQPFQPVKNNIVRNLICSLLNPCDHGGADFFFARSRNLRFVITFCLLIEGGVVMAQSPSPSSATEPDLNAPWPAAEKKGLRPKRVWPVAVPSQTPERVPSTVGAALPAAPLAPNGPPPAGEPAQPADFRQVTLIKGIVIVGSLKEFNPDGVPLKPGLTVPPKSLMETSEFALLSGWSMNQPLNEAKMRELQREIILYYRKRGRPLVDVLYPEQDVSNGMLQIIVIEGRLKAVKVQDSQGNPYTNGWSGVKHLQEAIRLRPNEEITESRIAKDLDWLNRNPLRRVEAVYEPDRREYGYTSILLRADEQRQWSASVGYEDSGTRLTDENRITAGVLWAKAFGLTDHQFRYDFTANPGFDLLRAHAGNYYIPLPWRHGLRFSGYYLQVQGDAGSGVTLKGEAYQTSMRYEVPLPTIGRRYQQELSAGLDFKFNENNLLFNTASLANTPTEIFQIALGYSSLLPDPWGQTSFSVQGYYSPGDVTSENTDRFFNFSRPFAKAQYAYARFNIERTTRLPADFSWIIRGMVQIADGNLLPSEQLGLGGFATARGYGERDGNGDQGFFVSNELRTPTVSLWRYFSKTAPQGEGLQLLAFWDYGQVQNVKLLADEDPRILFSSVGAGLRYKLSRHFSLRFDYGWQLVDTGLKTPYNSRGHIGVVATY